MIVDDSDRSIRLAVGMLREGRVVAMPTETVYGLAADASNAEAVSRIFAAKGRPPDHPLIVHLGIGANLGDWARHVPEEASRLAEALWPGPLTVILERHASVLPEVTGGLDTVAIRIPAHPVTQRLLESFGGGLAAPSANRFGRVSPTTARDVCSDLGSAVDLVIDGGPCEIGVESTIVAFIEGKVTILRPGAISPEAIARVLGHRIGTTAHSPVRAPGMLASHYAPTTPLELCMPDEIALRGAELVSAGARVGVLALVRIEVPGATAIWDAGGDIGIFARSLYRYLRQADAEALDILVVELPPDEGLGVAVRDRLRRAARR
ncbi:MAG: L-threonylcarbamoyladenylate synthase [Acidimicrobiales bacterium]